MNDGAGIDHQGEFLYGDTTAGPIDPHDRTAESYNATPSPTALPPSNALAI